MNMYGVIAAGSPPAEVYCDLSVVEIALERLLDTCFCRTTRTRTRRARAIRTGSSGEDRFDLNDWREYCHRAEFTGPDCAFVLESENTHGAFRVPANPAVRATLHRAGHDDADWVLTFRRGRLVEVEGAAGAKMLADTAWQYHRLAAEGAVSADAIDRPPEWHEAYRPPVEAA